jgi:hypothetical protein
VVLQQIIRTKLQTLSAWAYLNMDDIHAPTVGSGPTSSGYSNGVPKEQLSLQELMAEKDRLEAELKALGQVLDSVRTSSREMSFQANRWLAAWSPYEHWPYHIRWLPSL